MPIISSNFTLLPSNFTRGWVAALGLCLVLSAWLPVAEAQSRPRTATVRWVIDGDTVVLTTGQKVRYLGMDAPETAHGRSASDCFGKEASWANRRLVLHRKVLLDYDRETLDRYGRLLAYVSLPDGRSVNEELLRGGYALVYRTGEGFAQLERFLAAQNQAIAARCGLWGACPVAPAPYYVAHRGSFVFHRPECPMGRRIGASHRARFERRLEAIRQGYRPCRRCRP